MNETERERLRNYCSQYGCDFDRTLQYIEKFQKGEFLDLPNNELMEKTSARENLRLLENRVRQLVEQGWPLEDAQALAMFETTVPKPEEPKRRETSEAETLAILNGNNNQEKWRFLSRAKRGET